MKSLPLSISANKVAVKARAAGNARTDTRELRDQQVIACVCLLFAADAEGNEGSKGWMWALQWGHGARCSVKGQRGWEGTEKTVGCCGCGMGPGQIFPKGWTQQSSKVLCEKPGVVIPHGAAGKGVSNGIFWGAVRWMLWGQRESCGTATALFRVLLLQGCWS